MTQDLLQLGARFLASTSAPQVLADLERELHDRRDPMTLQLLLKVRSLLCATAHSAHSAQSAQSAQSHSSDTSLPPA